MGLDMYLIKKTYVKKWDHIPADKQYEVTVTRGGQSYPNIDPSRVNYVEEEMKYWRKANQIHGWFVKNVQNGEDNCREYYVSKEDLNALLEDCYAVHDDPIDAPLILPISDGYFFGSEEYDEYYFDQIKSTIKSIETILQEWDEEADYYYQSSW